MNKYSYIVQPRHKARQDRIEGIESQLLAVLVTIMLSIAGIAVFGFGLIHAIDTGIENQDVMLCRSALQSKNIHYLRKCSCYYKSGDITCLQEGTGQ